MANRLPGFLVVGLSLGFAACGGDSLTIPPSTGTLQITTTTVGSDLDPDGYTLQVDALQPEAIGTTATVSVEELTPGAHNVVLTGFAGNCSVAGDNPRSVTIAVGQTTTAAFDVTCGGTTGALEVTAQTTGPSPDADGYAVSLDGTDRGPIGANAVVTLSNLPPGSHVVGLTGVAANCQVDGDNLRVVTIVAQGTATVTFAVTCVQPPPVVGVLRITTTTTPGPGQDADGYQFAVDGAEPQVIGVNATTDLANTAVGLHSVVLSNVASNCTVDDATKSAMVLAGVTVTVTFNITCGATTGSIRVATTTTGDNLDTDGYQFAIDGGSPQSVAANGDQTVAGVAAGSHTVVLSGIAGNCSGDESKNVTVAAGATSDVNFSINCTSTTPSASKSELSASPKDIDAGTESSTIKVTVKNEGGKVLGGVNVTLNSSGSGDTFTPTSATTGTDGVATFAFSSTVAGQKTITATAGGVTLTHTETINVAARPTTTDITGVSPEPSPSGQSIHVTFTVTPQGGGTPTGTVTIFSLQESGVGCTVDVGAGFCDFVLNTAGTHNLEATYSGDDQFEESSDPDGQTHEVTAADQAPTANNDPSSDQVSLYTTPGGGASLTVLAADGVLKNDTDPDPGTVLTASTPSSTTTNNGSVDLSSDGSFTYTPPGGFSGADTFSYTASDGQLSSSSATVTVNVTL
jgi:preprotein translocase subunit YajC